MDMVECGRVLNTHGVRGEIKAENYCDPGFFRQGMRVRIGGQPYEVTGVRSHKGFFLLTLAGVETVEQAMPLKGRLITLPRSEMGLRPGEYLYQDLYGFSVYDQRLERVIGTLSEVLERPASMVYVVESGEGQALIPALPPFQQKVDLENRVLTVRTIPGMLPHED